MDKNITLISISFLKNISEKVSSTCLYWFFPSTKKEMPGSKGKQKVASGSRY